jgi:hypothetical protein
MSFPSSPTNNQQAVVNNITYTYSTSTNTWTRVQAIATATSFAITGTTVSSSTSTGALTVAGGAGVGGNIYVSGSVSGSLAGSTIDGINSIGFVNIPQNAQTGNYTLVSSDAGKHIFHASGAAAATYTIPSNASVPFSTGTVVMFVNMSTSTTTIAISSDTMYLANSGTTTSRTLSQYGVATAVKISNTSWLISGVALS